MNERHFSLRPFPSLRALPDVELTGHIARHATTVVIRYALHGQLTDVVIPTVMASPTRQSRLWEYTCFELFLGLKQSDRYWEFNFSPAGHWNVYRFAAYRQEMTEELAFTSMPFTVEHLGDAFRLEVELDLAPIVPEERAVEAGLSVVLKFGDGETSYWALSHRGPRADFHRRDSFMIVL